MKDKAIGTDLDGPVDALQVRHAPGSCGLVKRAQAGLGRQDEERLALLFADQPPAPINKSIMRGLRLGMTNQISSRLKPQKVDMHDGKTLLLPLCFKVLASSERRLYALVSFLPEEVRNAWVGRRRGDHKGPHGAARAGRGPLVDGEGLHCDGLRQATVEQQLAGAAQGDLMDITSCVYQAFTSSNSSSWP